MRQPVALKFEGIFPLESAKSRAMVRLMDDAANPWRSGMAPPVPYTNVELRLTDGHRCLGLWTGTEWWAEGRPIAFERIEWRRLGCAVSQKKPLHG